MKFEVTTLKRRPELADQVDRLAGEAWPTFMLHADTPYRDSLFDTFAGFQILFCDSADTLIALGHTIPFVWAGTLEEPATHDRRGDGESHRRAPRTPCANGTLGPGRTRVVGAPGARGEFEGSTGHALACSRTRYELPCRARAPHLQEPLSTHPRRGGATPGKTRAGAPSADENSKVPSLWTTTYKPRDW